MTKDLFEKSKLIIHFCLQNCAIFCTRYHLSFLRERDFIYYLEKNRNFLCFKIIFNKINYILNSMILILNLLVISLFWFAFLSNICTWHIYLSIITICIYNDFISGIVVEPIRATWSRWSRFAVILAINHQGAPWYTRLKVAGERGRETVADSGQPTFRTAAPFFCAIRYNCRGLVTFAGFRSEVPDVYVAPCRLSCTEAASSKRSEEGRDAQWAEDEGPETRWTMPTVVAIARLPLVSFRRKCRRTYIHIIYITYI